MYYIVQWIDEFNNTQCRKFENETEAGKFADDLFNFYPVKVIKE